MNRNTDIAVCLLLGIISLSIGFNFNVTFFAAVGGLFIGTVFERCINIFDASIRMDRRRGANG